MASRNTKFGPAASQEQLNQDFLVWFAIDLNPFSMINNTGLRYFFSKNMPQLHIPDESTLRKKPLMEIYDATVDQVSADLADAQCINLMFDGWSDRHAGLHHIGLRAQFIRADWVGRVVTLSVMPCGSDALRIKEHIMSEIEHFIPNYNDKTIYSTHDGASVMLKVSKLLKVENWFHCAAHAVHLLLTTDSLKRIPEIMAVLTKCKSIVNALHFKSDILLREVYTSNDKVVMDEMLDKISHLMELQQDENSIELSDDTSLCEINACNGADDVNLALECDDDDSLQTTQEGTHGRHQASQGSGTKRGWRLQNEICTRWNSSLEMAESLLHMKSEVTNALKRIGKYDKCLAVDEWALLDELANFLQTFRGLTELVSCKVTSLSLIPLMRAEISDACRLTAKDCDELKSVKRLVMKNLDKRLPVSRHVELATLLDPATVSLLGSSDSNKEETLYSAVMESRASQPNSSSDPQRASLDEVEQADDNCGECEASSAATCSKKMRLVQKHSLLVHSADQVARDEVKRYLSLGTSAAQEDPLVFWKMNERNFPMLAVLAKRYLTQSASSVAVENMFSTTGIIVNGKRSTLAPHRLNWLTFIHDNYPLYFDMGPSGNSDPGIAASFSRAKQN